MTKPIKILHYVPGFDQGGIESRLLDWYRNIDRNKIQFDLIKLTSTDENKLIEEFKELGGTVHSLSKFSSKNYLGFRKDLKRIFKENEYNVAHCHSPSTGYFFLKEAKKNKIPVRIMHSRTTKFNEESSFVFIREYLRKTLNKYTTDYFSCSEEAGIWQFGEDAVLDKKVKIIKNGIENEKFTFNHIVRDEIRKELDLNDDFVIGHVGRFATAKNHTFLIDVFNKFHKINNNSKLILIGSGPLEREIQQKVLDLGLSKQVLFLGNKNDVEQYLQAIDLFLFPSHYEGFGTVVIEAQAAGLKSIVSTEVPFSVDITGLVKRINLSNSSKIWAEEISKHSFSYVRKNTQKEIKSAGYDAKSSTKYLEELYLKNM